MRSISAGATCYDAGETLPTAPAHGADVVWMAEPSPGSSYDIKVAGYPRNALIAWHQVDENNLTQRDVEALPLNGIGLVNLTLMSRWCWIPISRIRLRRRAIADRSINVIVGADWCVSQSSVERHSFSVQRVFQLELNALVRRHFPHWGARDLLGGK